MPGKEPGNQTSEVFRLGGRPGVLRRFSKSDGTHGSALDGARIRQLLEIRTERRIGFGCEVKLRQLLWFFSASDLSCLRNRGFELIDILTRDGPTTGLHPSDGPSSPWSGDIDPDGPDITNIRKIDVTQKLQLLDGMLPRLET